MERHIASVCRVQMDAVKTVEGHIGPFQWNELQKDLHCTRCDFVAVSASKLKRHMMKHNLKPIKVEEKCPKCDMTFKYKSDLNRHILTSHCSYVKGNSRANHYSKMKKLGACEQARKPRSYASLKLRPGDLLTGVKCRATSVAKNHRYQWFAKPKPLITMVAFQPFINGTSEYENLGVLQLHRQ